MQIDQDSVCDETGTYTRPVNVMVILNDNQTYSNLIGCTIIHYTNHGYSKSNDRGKPYLDSNHYLGSWRLE